jgi:hypothetical protein
MNCCTSFVSVLLIAIPLFACNDESADQVTEPPAANVPPAETDESDESETPSPSAANDGDEARCRELAQIMVFQGHPAESERDQRVLATWTTACVDTSFLSENATLAECVESAPAPEQARECEGFMAAFGAWEQATRSAAAR